MQKHYYWISLCLLAFVGLFCTCGENNTDSKEIDKNGYKYIYHLKNGGPTPQPTEYASYHYTMSVDDSLMTNSRDLNQVASMQIPPVPPAGSKQKPASPILEGLRTMSPGDSITVKIPMDSLRQIPPGFEKYEYLIYDLDMIEIVTQEEMQTQNQEKAKQKKAQQEVDMSRENDVKDFLQKTITEYKSGKLDDQLKETSGGLKYIIHELGTGKTPKAKSPIKVHYYGMLPDGTPFDNSFKRGTPYFFTLGAGQVIKGWDEGIVLLPIGTKATLFIPPAMGYGVQGSPPTIPPNSDLIFYVEIMYPY